MASLKDLPTTGVYILVFLVIVVVSSVILQDIKDEKAQTSTISISNETITNISTLDTWYQLNIKGGLVNSSVIVTNSTLADTLPSAAYAVDTILGRLLVTAGWHGIHNISLNISYNYNYALGSSAFNVTDEGLKGIINFSEQSSTLTTVIIFGVIMSILIAGFLFLKAGGTI